MLNILQYIDIGHLLVCLYGLLMAWGVFRLERRNEERKKERIARQKDSNEPPKEFTLDVEMKEGSWFAIIFLVGFIPLSFFMILFEGNYNSLSDLFVFPLALTVIIGPIVLLFLLFLKIILPYVDIAIDEDGLWYKHQGKESGLVPWESIILLKRNLIINCIDVFDSGNQRLIRIYHKLNDIDELQDILLEKVQRNSTDNFPESFSAGYFYHLLHFSLSIICLYFVVICGIFGEMNCNKLFIALFYLFVFALYILKYLLHAHRVQVSGNSIVISYPFRKVFLNAQELNSIEAKYRKREISIRTTRNKKYSLNMGSGYYMLYLSLKRGKENCESSEEQ